MGLFDIFKRKSAVKSDASGPLMTIEDVFLIKNVGIILTGKLQQDIAVGDKVSVNNKAYKVMRIDAPPQQVKKAAAGMNVGILLDTMNAQDLKHGDVVYKGVVSENAVSDNAVSDNAVSENTVSDNAVSENAAAVNNAQVSDDYIQALIKLAKKKYIPNKITAEHFETIFDMLNLVLPADVIKIMLESDWRSAKIQAEHDTSNAEEIIVKTFADSGYRFNRYMGCIVPSFYENKIKNSSEEELLKAFIAADFYAYYLKEEYTANLRMLQKLIANELLNRGFDPNGQKFSDIIVRLEEQKIYIDTIALQKWAKIYGYNEYYEYSGSMPLKEAGPILSVYENGKLVQSYTLETKTGEDFTGKYFQICIRLTISGDPLTPAAVMDGFIADSQEETKMEFKHTGYRFEALYLDRESEATKIRQARVIGEDLYAKVLRYPGYMTPANVRLVGVCQSCRKSFTFIGYNFPHMQAEAVYSDDGLDVMELSAYEEIDKDTWSYEKDGKIFRYYNSFNCPHCGEPYIDYKKHPENKEFGVLGCTLLGREPYRAD